MTFGRSERHRHSDLGRAALGLKLKKFLACARACACARVWRERASLYPRAGFLMGAGRDPGGAAILASDGAAILAILAARERLLSVAVIAREAEGESKRPPQKWSRSDENCF